MRKVGLLGGTFNPIHEGHVFVAKQALHKLNLDEVLLIPNRQSPFRMDEEQVSFEHRFEMCSIALEGIENINVCDIEKDLPIPSYTLTTVEKLLEKDADTEYYLIIGDDQANKFMTWYKADKLLEFVKVVVCKRHDQELTLDFPYIELFCEKHPASATEIRNGNFLYLNRKVREYVFKNELYIKDIVKSKMSNKRFEHSLSVQKLSIELAQAHGLDVTKASLAALLHDICKEFDEKTTLEYMALESEEARSMHPNVYHQFVGARYVEEKLQISDFDILNAIRYHTTGGVDNPYVYILFIADKIDPLRGYDISEELALAKIDLKTTYGLVKCKQMAYIRKDI